MSTTPCTPQHLFSLLEWIRTHRLRNGRTLPLCIWGDRGVGKTQVVADFARTRGMEFLTYHPAHDRGAGDLIGELWRDEETNHTHFSAPHFLPSAHDAAALRPTGILLIDELNRASDEVLSGLFELIGEGEIGQSGYQLPPGWQVVCCCNPPSDDYTVNTLDAALIDRMLHVTFSFAPGPWLDWATDQGLEEDVVAYVRENLDQVAVSPPGLPPGVHPLPTPRALEHFATLYEPTMDRDLREIIAYGLLGPTAARTFLRRAPGPGRPLTGEQMLRGLWRRYFPRWLEGGGEGEVLLRKSVGNLLVSLRSQRRDPVVAAALCEIRATLDPRTRGLLAAALEAHQPDWLQLMDAIDAGITEAESTPQQGEMPEPDDPVSTPA